jgi:diguanylate cyclase (GGDEF)-like protein
MRLSLNKRTVILIALIALLILVLNLTGIIHAGRIHSDMGAFSPVVVIALIGIAGLIILNRKMLNPTIRPDATAKKISNKNIHTALDVLDGDGSSGLTRLLNGRTGTIKISREEIERLVQKRTVELTLSNNKLLQEIGESRRMEEQLQYDAFHDALTGLPNRALFMNRLEHLLQLSKRRTTHQFAVLFMDVDRFKLINDSLGHMMGDNLLVSIGQRLLLSLKPGDTISRFGGDEFAILLEDIIDIDNILNVAERIQMELCKPFKMGEHEIFTTASIGVTVNSPDYETPEQILRDADIAMYQAKAKGRSCSVVFEKGMHALAVELLKLETDLRKAVERNEFVVYYQPVVSSVSNCVIGYEALVRWKHPERGLLYPSDFINIAEETGLIVFIDRFVLREACMQMSKWQHQFPESSLKFISVNISNKQFLQADMIEYVTWVINETNIIPSTLKIEITENVIIENPETLIGIFSHLRSIGIQLYIDDFGTGYSSLSYLHLLPIDGIKIDRSFIRRIGNKGENNEIIKTIMLLAQDMNVNVIAEGIETENQLENIKTLKCDYWQGFLFFKPVDSEHAEALIKTVPDTNTSSRNSKMLRQKKNDIPDIAGDV